MCHRLPGQCISALHVPILLCLGHAPSPLQYRFYHQRSHSTKTQQHMQALLVLITTTLPLYDEEAPDGAQTHSSKSRSNRVSATMYALTCRMHRQLWEQYPAYAPISKLQPP